jgi:hypothetical protein
MQEDIKDLISNETILKAFLLKFENKKIIIEFFNMDIKQFILMENEYNVYYYGNFSYFQGITFEDISFEYFPASEKSIISGATRSWYSQSAVNSQCLKITIL